MQSAVNAVDPEAGGGELTVRIPKEVLACANGKNYKCAIFRGAWSQWNAIKPLISKTAASGLPETYYSTWLT